MCDTDNDLAEKRFDLERWSGKRLQTKNPSLVTIVSAIVCKNAIIMASDSRTFFEDANGGRKIKDDTKKIYAIQMPNKFAFLVGQAGNDDLGMQAVELMVQIAEQTPMNDYRAAAEVAEKACKQLKDKIRLQFVGTAEELQKHFEKYDFDLMLTHYFKDASNAVKPYIFTLQFSLGMARIQRKGFISIGCGSPIADYILDQFDVSKLDSTEATAAAVYVVEQAKKFDLRCGGNVQVGASEKFFTGGSSSGIFSAILTDAEMVNDYRMAVSDIGKELQSRQHHFLKEIFSKAIVFFAQRSKKIKDEHGGIQIGIDGSISPYTPLNQDPKNPI